MWVPILPCQRSGYAAAGPGSPHAPSLLSPPCTYVGRPTSLPSLRLWALVQLEQLREACSCTGCDPWPLPTALRNTDFQKPCSSAGNSRLPGNQVLQAAQQRPSLPDPHPSARGSPHPPHCTFLTTRRAPDSAQVPEQHALEVAHRSPCPSSPFFSYP